MATRNKSKTVKLLPYEKEQKDFEQEVEKAKHEIEIKLTELQNKSQKNKLAREQVETVKEELIELKREVVNRLGKKLEKSHSVEKNKICKTLAIYLKGYVSSSYINKSCDDRWKQLEYDHSSTQSDALIEESGERTVEQIEEEIRDQQQAEEYQQVVQEDFETVGLMNDLIRKLTGLDNEERGKISAETAKGENWRKELVQKTKDFRFEKFRKLTPGDVKHFLGAIQTLHYILEDSMIQLDTELERREREVIKQ